MSSVRCRRGGTLIGKYLQPVIQILAKGRLLHHARQITMCGGDQADVNLVRAVAAEPLEFLLLQDAQQFRLKFQRDVADLVQKKRALVREFKASRLLRDGASECAFFVTEQFTLEKPQRDRSAVQFDEGTVPGGCSDGELRAQSAPYRFPSRPGSAHSNP